MGAELQISMGSRLEDLSAISGQISAFLDAQSAPPAVVFAVELALEELITNTLKYGYDDDSTHTIDVAVRVDNQQAELVLSDDGHPFDPLKAAEPDLTLAAEDRPIGGLGLHLVRKMMTALRYERIGDRNVVTAIKTFEASAT